MSTSAKRDESKRLKALYSYGILDTAADKNFDDLTTIASFICGTPVALITLLDKDRQWFKSNIGFSRSETPIDQAFCTHAIEYDDVYEVPDTHKNSKFIYNPLVTGDPHIRFYAGAPLFTPEGIPIGTICVIDNKPRKLNQHQKDALKALSRQVVNLLELKKNNLEKQSIIELFHENNTRLSTLINNLQAAVLFEDNDGNVSYINHQYRSIFRISDPEEEIIGNNVRKAHSFAAGYFNTPDRYMREIGLIAAERRIVKQEVISTNDGRFLERDYIPVADDSTFIGNLWLFRDITEKRIVQDELDKFRIQLSAVLNTIGEGVITMDSETRIIMINKEMEILTQYSREELVGQKVGKLLSYEKKSNSERNFNWYLFPQNLGKYIKLEGKRKDSSVFPVEVKIQETSIDGDIYYTTAVKDITNREKQFRELGEARRIAEESTKAREQFLANMSHEIRTPMNAIIGLTNLMLQLNPQGKELEYVSAINRSAENLLAIINDILDLSKILAGKFEFEKIEFSLRDQLQQIYTMMGPRIDEKRLSFEVKNDPGIPEVIIGDPGRLNQILLNLISNAVKFTDNGKITLNVELADKKADSVEILFSVKDTGIGIPEDKLAYIFESFSQINTGRTRNTGGTGLGLAISRKLVELQGGVINVTSQINKGSVFTFTLRFGKSSRKEIVKKQVFNEFEGSLNGLKILIAEDNKINQLVITRMLEIWNADYKVLDNGKKVIEELKSNTYDIILMDLSMPVMDGYDTSEFIRRELPEPARSIPIVALTASAQMDSQRKVFDCGMNGFLAKPFKPKELFNQLIELTKYGSEINNSTNEISETVDDDELIYDLSYLKELGMDSEEFTLQIIDNFIKDVLPVIQIIGESIDKEDFEKVKSSAHKVKPSFGYLGIRKAEELLNEIERVIKEQRSKQKLKELHYKILDYYKTAERQLMIYIKKHKE